MMTTVRMRRLVSNSHHSRAGARAHVLVGRGLARHGSVGAADVHEVEHLLVLLDLDALHLGIVLRQEAHRLGAHLHADPLAVEVGQLPDRGVALLHLGHEAARHHRARAGAVLDRPEDTQRPGDARLVANGRFGRTVRRRVAARVDGVGLRHEVHVLVDDRQIQHEDHAREARWNQRDATRVGSEAHVDERETQVVVDELEAVGLHAHDLITALTYNHQRAYKHTPTHQIQSS